MKYWNIHPNLFSRNSGLLFYFFSASEILICSFLAFLPQVLFAADIYMKDGTVIKNVDNLRQTENLFIFKKHGSISTVSKYKVRKIIDDSGKLIFEHMKLVAEKFVDNDGRTGYLFFKNGKKVASGVWKGGAFVINTVDSNMPDGIYIQYYDSGPVERTFSIKNNQLNGYCRVYYESGKLKKEGFFKNGKENGESKLYYETGELKGKSIFIDGKKNGPTKLYFKSGKLKALMNFKDDKLEGIQKTFYENGAIETIVSCKNNLRQGPIKQYYESGKIMMEGNFKNDKLEGIVIIYYESGRIKKQKRFVNGRIYK